MYKLRPGSNVASHHMRRISLYTDVVYFSFRSFGKHRRARERARAPSTVFEEKIDGL